MKRKEKIFLAIVVLFIFGQFVKYGLAVRVIIVAAAGYYVYTYWRNRR